MTSLLEAQKGLEAEWETTEGSSSLTSPLDYVGDWIVSHPPCILVVAYLVANKELSWRSGIANILSRMPQGMGDELKVGLELALWQVTEAWRQRLALSV